MERIGADQLAGIAQDSARACTKAWNLLHQDIQAMPGFHRVAYITCGEHCAQLVNQDLAKIHPWLKDRWWVSECCSCLPAALLNLSGDCFQKVFGSELSHKPF